MMTYVNSDGNVAAIAESGPIQWGPLKFLPGAIHTGGISTDFPASGMVRFPDAVYASYLVCHQATNITLLEGGVSNTVALGNPSWSTAASTLVYGNYGGGLLRAAGQGVHASHEYDQ